MRRVIAVTIVGVVLAVAAPGGFALAQSPGADVVHVDPWQKFNRASFAVHQFIDRALLRPLAMAYQAVLPKPLRDGVHNVLSNLGEPVVVANDVFQGRFRKAGLATGRFATNSTLGLAGLFDVATRVGEPHHDNSFGVTLARIHVASGPYLFIPLAGPSTVRDAVGTIVDGFLDPLHWAKYPHSVDVTVGRIVIGGLDTRARVDGDLQALFSDATDPYATLRSVYLQNRQSQIDGGATTEPALPDFGDEHSPSAAPAAPPVDKPADKPAAEAPPPADAPAEKAVSAVDAPIKPVSLLALHTRIGAVVIDEGETALN